MKRFLLAALLGLAMAAPAHALSPQSESPEVAARTLVAAAGDARLILLGEMHGTREIPQLVAHVMSIYAAQRPVLLGLEIPGSGQPDLRRYIDSPGSDADRAALLATPFWQVEGDQHDGRRSHDMIDLIDHVRQLRAQGRDVSLLAYDAEPGPRLDANERDRIMAARVRASFNALPRGRLLVLTGNGDVLEPENGIAAIGSGGAYAQSAALALLRNTELSPEVIVKQSLEIAGDLCIYTNQQHLIETLE